MLKIEYTEFKQFVLDNSHQAHVNEVSIGQGVLLFVEHDGLHIATEIATSDTATMTDYTDTLKPPFKSEKKKSVKVDSQVPFDSKELPDGKKIYKRKHGIKGVTIAAEATHDFVYTVPYVSCKITDVEIIGGREDDEVDFFILDTDAGTVSGVPSYPLNQFGFDVQIMDGKHREHSNYDADLFQGLKIQVTYKNNSTTSTVKPKVNLTLHEVK